mmetsp:Transcript_30035/g.67952  ORF Transcript_30035/g.67952 Transcript_30035/m.67952 type:complete len:117 (-) Transcript_30035:653-1003(-)
MMIRSRLPAQNARAHVRLQSRQGASILLFVFLSAHCLSVALVSHSIALVIWCAILSLPPFRCMPYSFPSFIVVLLFAIIGSSCFRVGREMSAGLLVVCVGFSGVGGGVDHSVLRRE